MEGVTLTTIKLPAVQSIVDVDGRSTDDVFVLADDAEVLEVVRGKARSLGKVSCPQVSPYGMGATYEPRFVSVLPTKTGARLDGFVTRYGRGSWTEVYSAASRAGGGWSCEASGEPTLVPRWRWGVPGFPSVTFDGRDVPQPASMGDGVITSWTGGPAHAWVYFSTAGLVEYNGSVWTPRPLPPFGLDAIADDDAGTTWAVGGSHSSDTLARWDGKAWSLVPVPEDFVATQILVAGATTWFFGPDSWYAWDGRSLGRVAAPIDAIRAWVAPSGEVWVGGRERTAGPITEATTLRGALVEITRTAITTPTASGKVTP